MAKKSKKGYTVHIGCRTCNKPLVYVDKYGMFCEDKCNRAESIKIGKAVEKLFSKYSGPTFVGELEKLWTSINSEKQL